LPSLLLASGEHEQSGDQEVYSHRGAIRFWPCVRQASARPADRL